MNKDEQKARILEFLKKHQLGVIATSDPEKNTPQSAVVGFAETENLELLFGTANTTRKYKNLQKNQHISFVIGWDGRVGTLQYEGVAREMNAKEKEKYVPLQIKKNPQSAKFMSEKTQTYFLVKPTWIRLTDMSKSPNEIMEIAF